MMSENADETSHANADETDAEADADADDAGSVASTQMTTLTTTTSPPSYEHVLSESSILNRTYEKSPNQRKAENEPQPPKVKAQQIVHKSSKDYYRAVAAQFGITCKMSDHCRCLDCQGQYLDCEYDRDNEQEKTDGGLAAGTPMYLSEVMHGTACSIL